MRFELILSPYEGDGLAIKPTAANWRAGQDSNLHVSINLSTRS